MQQDNGTDKVAVEGSTSVWASSEADMQVSDDHPSLLGPNTRSTGIELLVLAGQQTRLPENLLFCKAWHKPVQSDCDYIIAGMLTAQRGHHRRSHLGLYICDLRKDTYLMHPPVNKLNIRCC